MANRMDRYNRNTGVSRRTSKNQELYHDMKDIKNITEEVNIEPVIEVDLNKQREKRQIKYQNITSDNLSPLYRKEENKEYDINKVIINAKEKRINKDDLENRRKLVKDEYNITKSIDLKNIEQYKNKKEDIEIEPEEDNNKDLMDDLMPGDNDETIIDEEMATKLVEREKLDVTSLTNELKNLDKSFFTKSMELSKTDLIDMDTSFVDEKKHNIWLIILLVLVILIVIGLLVYFIYKNI